MSCPVCGSEMVALPTVHCPKCTAGPVVTFSVTAAPVPQSELPAWRRKHTCSQCPAHAQPPGGFDFLTFYEHVSAHTAEVLREVTDDARQYRASLDAIDRFLRDNVFKDWPVDMIRDHVGHWIDLAIRRFDDAYWAEKDEERKQMMARVMVTR